MGKGFSLNFGSKISTTLTFTFALDFLEDVNSRAMRLKAKRKQMAFIEGESDTEENDSEFSIEEENNTAEGIVLIQIY